MFKFAPTLELTRKWTKHLFVLWVFLSFYGEWEVKSLIDFEIFFINYKNKKNYDSILLIFTMETEESSVNCDKKILSVEDLNVEFLPIIYEIIRG